jgi:antitoxin FitA
MPQLLVRNVADDTVAELKARAAAHGRSLEAEVRAILEVATKPSREELLRELDAIRAQTRPWQPGEPTAAATIREDRDSR